MASHDRFENREFKYNEGRGIEGVKVSVTLQCCSCDYTETRDFKHWTSDDFVRNKFKTNHWLLGRDHRREADKCPTCMGVNPANKLADRFRTTQDGKTVRPGSEIVAQHGQARDRERDRVLITADNLFKPKPAVQAEVPEMKPAEPAPSAAPLAAPLATDLIVSRLDKVIEVLANQTATFDLLLESMSGVQAAMTGIQEREKQAIAATAALTSMISRTQEGTASGLMQVVQVVRDGHDGMVAGLVQVVQAIRETQAPPVLIETKAEVLPPQPEVPALEVDPSLYAEFDPTVESIAAADPVEMQGIDVLSAGEPELVDQIVEPETPLDMPSNETIDLSDIMLNPVYSKMEAGTRPYTIIKIEREAFDRTGISPTSRVVVEYLSAERRLNVREVQRGGVKIKMANNRSVHIQHRGLGDLNMDKALCITGSNEFSLRAM